MMITVKGAKHCHKGASDLAAQGKGDPLMQASATGSLDMSSPRSTIIPLNSPFLTLPSTLVGLYIFPCCVLLTFF